MGSSRAEEEAIAKLFKDDLWRILMVLAWTTGKMSPTAVARFPRTHLARTGHLAKAYGQPIASECGSACLETLVVEPLLPAGTSRTQDGDVILEVIGFDFADNVYQPVTGIYARDASGGSEDACICRLARCTASAAALGTEFPPCASITSPTPHASHRTSVRCPLKGLS